MDEERNTIEEEKQSILDSMSGLTVDTEEYQKMLSAVEALTRIQKIEMEAKVTREKMEREANLAESKAKAELQIREAEAEVKKKESRRGIVKVLIAGLFGIWQIVLVSQFEETKALFGKAWNFVSKPKL